MKRILVIIIVVLVCLSLYAFLHDKYGYDAYVRIETGNQAIDNTAVLPTQNNIFANIVVNDFTYFNKQVLKNVKITVNGKTSKVIAFSAMELPRKGALKQSHIIVIVVNPKAITYLKSVSEKNLTYYYSDGTEITKPIQ
ncbi:hypothetical protein [Pectinatus frisingensis]|uniref:hypothetical protein n=1 Tax=Pectinatus frisingensis TaxID=865 RepID=UPI0018C7B215|nr:hypothetical protein [Pectinatus frisingensis]